MLARGVASLIFQMITGSIVDACGANAYTYSYYLYAATMLVCMILCSKIQKTKIDV